MTIRHASTWYAQGREINLALENPNECYEYVSIITNWGQAETEKGETWGCGRWNSRLDLRLWDGGAIIQGDEVIIHKIIAREVGKGTEDITSKVRPGYFRPYTIHIAE